MNDLFSRSAPTSAYARGHGRRMLRTLALTAGAGIIVLATALPVILALDANLLRGPIARIVGGSLDREFVIKGDLHIGFLPQLNVELNDVALGNTPWGSRMEMATLEKAVVSIELLPLLRRRVVLPEVSLTAPSVLLERDVDGEPNWRFGSQEGSGRGDSANLLQIRSLSITRGSVSYIDPAAQTDITIRIDSEAPRGNREGQIRFSGDGSLRSDDFELNGHANSPLNLADAGKPYRISFEAKAGSTRAWFAGGLVPFEMETIDGDVALQGKDLSALYPLVPVPLPWTPAYSISGHLTRDAGKYALRGLNGRVGGSDVEGQVSIEVSDKRPVMSADIQSQRLDYKDLLGLLGEPPPDKGQRPRDQQETAQALGGLDRVLPSKPYSVTRLRGVDADVTFRGRSIVARDIPLDHVAFHLKLKDGILVLDPMEFGVAGGRVISHITLDAHQDPMLTRGDATATDLELKRLLPKLKQTAGSAGKLGGRVKLATRGNSVAQMLGSANGEIALIMDQGRLSTLSLVLTNLDLANATRYVLRGDPDAPVYCVVVDATVREGAATPNIFVVDSSEESIRGTGDVDFKNENYRLRLVAKSKHASLVALRGPIKVGGTFKHPEVHPELGRVALRAGAAIALGALLTPAASLLALIDPGGAKDRNCGALIDQARHDVAAKSIVAPARAAPPSAGAKEQPVQRGGEDVR